MLFTNRVAMSPRAGILLVLLAAFANGRASGSSGSDIPSFTTTIAPVLADRCMTCHGATRQKGGYRLDSFTNLLTHGDSGKSPIVPGDPGASHLFELITTTDVDDRMPQKGDPLEPAVIERIRQWIAAGAPFDGVNRALPLFELLLDAPYPPAPASYAFPVPLRALAFVSPDRLAVGAYHEITFWTVGGTLLSRVANLPERLRVLVLHPDGHRLFFAGGAPGRDGVAGWIDLADPRRHQFLVRTADEELALAVSPDGSQVAAAGTDPIIQIFDGTTGQRLRTVTGHADWVLDLAFNADGTRLASASRDRTARVVDPATGITLSTFREHNDAVMAVLFIDTGRVATAGRDGRIRTWRAANAAALHTSANFSAEPTRLVLASGHLLSAWTDGSVRELADDLQVIHTLSTKDDRALGLAFTAGGDTLAVGSHQGRVRIWERTTARDIGTFIAVPGAEGGGQ